MQVMEERFEELRPALECPHCGAGWYRREDDAYGYVYDSPGHLDGVYRPLTASGRHCAVCVEAACGTDEALLKWYLEDVDIVDLMYFDLGNYAKVNNEETRAMEYIQAIRENEPETFLELLREYSQDRKAEQRSDYWFAWLKANDREEARTA